MEDKKHILLVSYVFPPYYGIGGRRWAKHAAELTKLGYVVHVICARNPFAKTSLWWNLVKDNPNIIIHQLPRRYPKVLVKFDHSLLEKIAYKFWFTLLPYLTRGSFLDRTIFWEHVMLRKAGKVIRQHQIRHVICTGGPFGVMYQVTKLRRRFPDIFILNDLRDPWTWGPNWGYPNLPPGRMAYELAKESKAIEDSDLFSVPSLDMSVYLKNKYPKFKDKFIHIPHFFDPSEACAQTKTSSDRIRLVMYGNIYHNIEDYVQQLAKQMSIHRDAFTLDIYTDKQHHWSKFREQGADNVRFFDQLDAKLLFKKFADYDYVLLFSPSYNINNISTKFYEIISTKTPIILFCEKGQGSDFLVSNRLGMHADLNSIGVLLDNLAAGKSDFIYNRDYDISPYSLGSVTRQISETLTEARPFAALKSSGKPERQVLLTFDYELFLGERSGTVDNCILKPTAMIIQLLEKHRLKKALFFVDTTYLMRLAEQTAPEARNDYQRVFDQLVSLLKKGHLIFPHLHPHWIDAVYIPEQNQWDLSDTSKYRFHSIPLDTRKQLFAFSIQLICEIQLKAGVHYAINAYRAGGWCIQPFEDFRPFFEKHQIVHEFSVLKHFENHSRNIYYDYRNVPNRSIYRFDSQIEKEVPDGPFLEYSISSIRKPNRLFIRLWAKYLVFRGIKNFGDGFSAVKSADVVPPDSLDTFSERYIHSENYEMVSIELLTRISTKAYRKFLKDNFYCHFISHPKMVSMHNLRCFDRLLRDLSSKYDLQTDYERMS